jgi:hypothetical protein
MGRVEGTFVLRTGFALDVSLSPQMMQRGRKAAGRRFVAFPDKRAFSSWDNLLRLHLAPPAVAW